MRAPVASRRCVNLLEHMDVGHSEKIRLFFMGSDHMLGLVIRSLQPRHLRLLDSSGFPFIGFPLIPV